jgi:hypothetical protein
MIKKLTLISTLLIFLLLNCTFIFAADEVTIAGGSVGGSWFPVASAISELLNKELGESIASAKPGGGVSNPMMVSKGTVSAGFSYSSYLVAGKKGEDPYKEKISNLKSIVMLFPMYFQAMGSKNLPYDYLGDFIKNEYPLNMSPTKPGHGDFWVTQKVFNILDVDFEKIENWGGKVEFAGGGEMASLYKDRHIDMAFTHNVVPLSSFSDMAVSRESKLIKIDVNIIEKLIENYGMKKGVIPAGTYKGTDVDIVTAGMPAVLFIREDIPDDIAYSLAKVVCENTEYLTSVNKLFKDFDPATACGGLGIELHPGALKYYQEMGYIR